MGFHPERYEPVDVQAAKHQRVLEDAAHAALVLDGTGRVQAWAQYGSPEELSRIKNSRLYRADPPARPDWRITCVYVDPRHRGQGLARVR